MKIITIVLICSGFLSCHVKSDTGHLAEADTSPIKESAEAKPLEQDPGINLQIVTGKFDPKTHPSFTKVDIQYADREGLFLQKRTYDSFKQMHAAAKKDGIDLIIKSATRNFDYQKGIWERKWTGTAKIENGKNASISYPMANRRALKILEYSSMPGTSRHHWGTDIDLNNFENEYFSKGEGLTIYNWLGQHAADYGFCQVYTEKNQDRPNGYNEEKWHWSYLPVAQQLTALAKSSMSANMIAGFQGAEVAEELDVINNYVLGINPACQITNN